MASDGPSVTTLLFVLAKEEEYRTDGTATVRYTVIDVPGLKRLGPWIKSMRVHWEGETFTANFQAKVVLDWSVSGKTRSSPVDVLGFQTAAGQAIGADYTNTANFGLDLNISIGVSNEAGAAVESGRITAVLEVTLKT